MKLLRSTIVASTISLWATSAAPSVQSGIDLTPTVTEYVALGIKHQQVRFKKDTQRIEFEPPDGWNLEGSPNQIRLTPPQKKFAEAFITATPLAKPQPLDDNAVKLLEQLVLAGLPVGSQFAKIEDELPNSVLVGGNASLEIIVSYQSTGEKFVKSVLFADLPDTQLTFRLTARKDDFQALHRDFKTSIFSWHSIEPDGAAAEKPVAAQ